jgi:putative DNA primase/helicase
MQSQSTLNTRHTNECTTKRGLAPEWIEVNCRSVSASEAKELLGYTAYSDGIWLEGANFQGQFKPDKPWESRDETTGKKSKPKYRTSIGEYDVMLPKHPENPRYWDDLEALKLLCYIINGIPCLVITEGFFKAICGCSNGIPTIALLGVEMGLTPGSADPQGKRYLVEGLERFARAGFGFIHAFDADCATNENVIMAQLKLAHQLAKFKVPQYSVTGLWTIDEGKGMDDFIRNNSAEAFIRNILAKAITIEEWEKQFKSWDDVKKVLSPRETSKYLVERYRNLWKYDLERQTWRQWDGKIWVAVSNKVFAQSVYRTIETNPESQFKTFSYLENVIKFLELELLEQEWKTFDRMEWIAFNDCVYEVKTGKIHEHAPGFGFISCLEHNFPKLVAIDSNSALLDQLRIGAPNFYAWAMHSQQGDPSKVLKLLAIINGAIKFRFFELQMFVHLQGVPGAGKGTYARLLETIVGKPNYTSAKLNKLGDDNVIAAIIDKQLVICPDEKKQACDFSGLLTLTGGDNIPYIAKYKPQADGKFYGLIVVISNSNPFIGDVTGIDRRLSLVTFDVPLPCRDMAVEEKMQAEVPQLTALALTMNDQEVKDLIKGTGTGAIPDFKRMQWLHKTENDSVALFMEEMLMPATPDKYVMLGGKGDDINTLYGAYMQMCEENNSKSLFTKNNFRGHLLELCREVGWANVREARQGNGWRIYGVSLRDEEEEAPRISEWLGECRQCRPSVDKGVDPKPLPSKESVGCVDQNAPFSTFEHALLQKMLEVWDNLYQLGEIVLKASEEELQAAIQNCTPEQIAHIKDAANSVWRPGLNRDADYNGERVEIWEAGSQKREVTVRTKSGAVLKIKRGNLRPWLGI